MILSRPFEVVTPTVDGDVLGALASVDAAFTPPQLHALLGLHSVAGVRNSLVRLSHQGIVHSELVGRAYVYSLNRDHVAAPHIVGLADAGREVVRRMQKNIQSWNVPCDYAALFGSAATGRMTESSDLDVFIVRPNRVNPETNPRWPEQVDGFARACTAWTGNDTRILEMPAAEVTRGAAAGRVLADITRDGVRLAGPAGYLIRTTVTGKTRKR